MPLYDLMLLLDPGAPSDRQESILSDVQGLLESGGTLVGSHDWGQRRMTFEIDHRPDAAYHLFQFETEKGGALLDRVDHSLKITDGVLRHRIIRLKDGSPPPPMPAPERGAYSGYEDAPPVPAADPAAAEDAPALADAAPADAPAPDAAVADAPADTAAVEDAPALDPEAAPVAEEQEAGPAGGGGDDEAPSGPTAA
jgi:small subunit ribosomal protein S6